MDWEQWMIILLHCAVLSVTIDVPDGVEVKCQSRYRVQAMRDKSVELKVVDNKAECDRLMRIKTPERTTNKDVIPSVTTAYTNGEYRANISWELTQTENRLPRLFLINLTFYDIKKSSYQYISDTCVLLRLIGNRRVKTKGLVQFYFDCLPLLDRPDVGLVVQLWSYTAPGRLCRSLRSVQQKGGPCGPDLKCSKEYSFAISKNAHSFENCACYVHHRGIPVLNWNYDNSKERFNINFTNVPPYLRSAVIEIVDSQSEDRLVEDIIVRRNSIHDGEIHAKSQMYRVGNYTVIVCVVLKLYLECEAPGRIESNYKQEIKDRCNTENNNYFLYSSQTLTVNRKQPDINFLNEEESWDQKRLQMILGVAGGLLVIAIVTGTTFFICQRRMSNINRSSHMPSSDETEMENLSGRRSSAINNDTLEHETEITGGDMQPNIPATPCPEKTDDVVDPGEKDERERLLQVNHDRNNLAVSCKATDQAIELRHLPQQNTRNSRFDNPSQDDGKLLTKTRMGQENFRIMLIYLPDSNNPQQIKIAADFEHMLTNDFGIVIERAADNIYDFAESAFDKYINVVLIISEDLVRVCHQYRYSKAGISEEIRSGRTSVILPCIVLHKMEKLIEKRSDYHHQVKPFLHMVCLDNDVFTDQALKTFLNDHSFLNTGNSSLHTLCERDFTSRNISPQLKKLIDSLKSSKRPEIPDDLKMKLMMLNKDCDSRSSQESFC